MQVIGDLTKLPEVKNILTAYENYQKTVNADPNSAYKKYDNDLFTNIALVGMDAVKDEKTIASDVSKLENT